MYGALRPYFLIVMISALVPARGQSYMHLFNSNEIQNSEVCALADGGALTFYFGSNVTRLDNVGGVVWTMDYGPDINRVSAAVELASGDLIFVMMAPDTSDAGTINPILVRTDPQGVPLNAVRCHEIQHQMGAHPMSLVQRPTGDLAMVINDSFTGRRLMRVTENLAPVWSRVYTGNNFPRTLLVSPSGSIYGIIANTLVKYDANGVGLWAHPYTNLPYFHSLAWEGDLLRISLQCAHPDIPGSSVPGIALVDTNGTFLQGALFDVSSLGFTSYVQTSRTAYGYLLCGYVSSPVYGSYVLTINEDSASASGWEDPFDFCTIRKAAVRPDGGMIAVGNLQDAAFTTDRFVLGLDPLPDLNTCFPPISADTVSFTGTHSTLLPGTAPVSDSWAPETVTHTASTTIPSVFCITMETEEPVRDEVVIASRTSDGAIVISGLPASAHVRVYDLLGHCVHQRRVNAGITALETTGWPTAQLVVVIEDDAGNLHRSRVHVVR